MNDCASQSISRGDVVRFHRSSSAISTLLRSSKPSRRGVVDVLELLEPSEDCLSVLSSS